METFTFTTVCGTLTLTIKGSMVRQLGTIHLRYDLYALFAEHGIQNYLHNPSGPAMINNINGKVEYWIDGKKVNDKIAEKMDHDQKFHDKLLDILN